MKLAIALIVIGAILLIDGGMRITLGLLGGDFFLVIAGILTGICLGGYLIYYGVKRYLRLKQTS